ncbi:unnamed protein product [Phytomonas sp. Hart1]|nr:unnamed protein product [Phytomonas sp. Hart1]|eukprot:CCW69480.1 unnamed protein product [Phytomonas sp. isolate Hart1]
MSIKVSPVHSINELRCKHLRETALIGFFLGGCAIASLFLILHAWFVSYNVVEFAFGSHIFLFHVVFHLTEFLVASSIVSHNVHPSAFMLFHSKEFRFACGSALVEFWVESCLIPNHLKLFGEALPTTALGKALCFCFRLSFPSVVLFEFLATFCYMIRVVAIINCGSNFSLVIESEKRDTHILVDSGLYAYFRHPSYFGWFWRVIFSQFAIANPVCLIFHTIITWYFFKIRIPYEEHIMEREDFFGKTYTKYKKSTFVGIPFIST